MNTTYSNSLVDLHANLVHTHFVDYVFKDVFTDLISLRKTSDGIMDEVHDIRNKYHADFVVMLMLETGDEECGIAYLGGNA